MQSNQLDIPSLLKTMQIELSKKEISEEVILSKEVENKLKTIKTHCNKYYANRSYYGNSSLNRKILLDPVFADNLTPEVLKAILLMEYKRQKKQKKVYNKNNLDVLTRDPGQAEEKSISLANILMFGFQEGTEFVQYMANNDNPYGLKGYNAQQKAFANNTIRIINTILELAKSEEIRLQNFEIPSPPQTSLVEQLRQINATIQVIKATNSPESKKLLLVPGYSADSMRSQTRSGWDRVLSLVTNKNDIDMSTEDAFDKIIDTFISNADIFLEGWIIHGFYDPAHIRAGLEQNTMYKIGGKNYSFTDIYLAIVKKLESMDNDILHKQFKMRLHLVDADLKYRFKNIYDAVQPIMLSPDSDQIVTYMIKCREQIHRLDGYNSEIAKGKKAILQSGLKILSNPDNTLSNFTDHIRTNQKALTTPHSSIPKNILKGLVVFIGYILGIYPGVLLNTYFFSASRPTTTGKEIVDPVLKLKKT